MSMKWLSAIGFALVLVVGLSQFPHTANAFECPKHFALAQAAIDNALEGMKGMEGMDQVQMGLLHSLIDDAKMVLAGALHNHEKPQGPFDHARAIAKAKTALAYAESADIWHFKMMM